MTLNKNNTNKNTVELRKELNAQGCTVENVYVNDRPFVCVGYVSERDKAACLKAIQTAIDTSENEYEAMRKLMTNAFLTDHEVEPDKEIDILGYTCFISYANKAIYETHGEEIANCREIEGDIPAQALDAILIPRASDYLHEEIAENDFDD